VNDLMEKNKDVSPNVIPIEFYAACCHIIKHDLIEVFKYLFLHKFDLRRIKYGILIHLTTNRRGSRYFQKIPTHLPTFGVLQDLYQHNDNEGRACGVQFDQHLRKCFY
jgi:hypothetical protein